MDDTVKRLLDGDQRALSRLISLVESGDPRGPRVMEAVYPHTGRAYCVGVTGPPGVGKSTIVDRLAQVMRAQGTSVGIIAVDPTSPYSGGAFLGDRVRMQRHYLDPGVFIRSMAARSAVGGLPEVVRRAVRLLDASGKDVVMVETVGVGQTELGVMGVADTVAVVLMPEAGDVIQTLKAGLMEIADVFVVNKADRDGADRMVTAVRSMLDMSAEPGEWAPPVVTTTAHRSEGIDGLLGCITDHREHLAGTSGLEHRRRERRREEFLGTIEEELGRRLMRRIAADPAMSAVLREVQDGLLEPYSAASSLLDGPLNIFDEGPPGVTGGG